MVQPRPKPPMSTLPETLRHEEATFHVPTTLPPQGATFEQADVELPPEPPLVLPVPPVPRLPAAPVTPPLVLVPAVPGDGSVVMLHAPAVNPNATAAAGAT